MVELRQISKIYASKGGQVPALVDVDLVLPASAVTVFSTFALSIGIAAISSALPIFTKIKKTPVDLLK